MKKIIALLLAIIMLLSLAACGGGGSDTPNDGAAEGGEPVENNGPAEGGEPDAAQPPESNKPADETNSALPIVVLDNEYATFSIVDNKIDDFWGPTLTVFCENKTEDTSLTFSMDMVAVNGYMLDPLWATTVAAGKKTNSDVTFFSSDLEMTGITSLDEVEFQLNIYDSEDWSVENFVSDWFTVYPTGLSAAEVTAPARPSSANEQIICDNEDCTFIIVEDYVDDFWGYTISLYMNNKSDKNLYFTWDDVSVNGYMVDPYWGCTVSAGKQAVATATFSEDDFETNGITDVEEVEFKLRVRDDDDWFSDDLVTEVFTYYPAA